MANDVAVGFKNAEDIPSKLVTAASAYIKTGELAKILKQRNTLYNALSTYSMVSTYDGGPETRIPLASDSNHTYTRIKDYDAMNILASEGITAAQYSPTMVAANIMLSKDEILDNKGKNQQVNLINAHTKILFETIANNFSYDLYSDGTLVNQISGLQSMIKTTAGSRYATIDTSVVTEWDNQRATIASNPSYEALAKAIDALFIDCDFGTVPNKGLITVDWFNILQAGHRSMGEINMLQKDRKPNEGSNSVMWRNVCDITYDHNANFGKTAQRLYLLNTNHVFLKSHSDANWTIDKAMPDAAVFAEISRVLWKGFFGTDQRKTLGVLST